VVGNNCHILWKIQISIVINKLQMSEDNFVCTAGCKKKTVTVIIKLTYFYNSYIPSVKPSYERL
jgi:hypothetical protein